jgi:mono/diheme cytochrome c family protein
MQKLLTFLFCGFTLYLPAQTTLPSVQEVYQIFQNKCSSCHGNISPAGGLDLVGTGATEFARAQNVASKLTNVNPSNTYAAARVTNGCTRSRRPQLFISKNQPRF